MVVPAISRVHPQLYITNITAARTEELPDDVDVVMTVCQDSIEDHIPESVGYRFFEMADGNYDGRGRCDYEFFTDAADTLLGLLVQGKTVLIHCHAGQSRSASVGIAALAQYEDVSYREMYRQVDEARPQIHPASVLEAHAQKYLGEEPDGVAARMRERAEARNEE